MLLLGIPAAANTRSAVMAQAAKPGQAAEAQKNLALNQARAIDDDGSTGDGRDDGCGWQCRQERSGRAAANGTMPAMGLSR